MKRFSVLWIYSSFLLCFLLMNSNVFGQFSEDSLVHIEVQGNDTDPFIILDGNKKHQVFYNPTSQSQNTLLLHLVGSIDNPNSTIQYPSIAANEGFHCINLAYRNGTSGQAACGDVPVSDCHLNYRKEIIEGIDYSPEVNVNTANSIDNRLVKLLQYLDVNYPSQNWAQYFTGSTVHWEKLIVSGHSQGGGHAAVIAITRPIQRVLMFASPNDYSDTLNTLASWTQLPHLVEDSNYYSFNALNDEVIEFWKQYAHSNALGLGNHGDTVNVDVVQAPYNQSRQLYTEEIVVSPNPLDLTHDVMIRDSETPVDPQGNPIFACAWRYMLGVECGISSIDEIVNSNIRVYPNPAKDIFNIERIGSSFNNAKIVILDVFGREKRVVQLNHGLNTINIQNLQKGMYFLQVIDGNKVINSKRIVKI